MYLRLFLPFFLCFLSLCEAKPPSLTPKDTKIKIEEILRAHVSFQQLNEEIVQRALVNYLDEIDPLKTYFIENEVVDWINPSSELLAQTVKDIKNENFTLFFSLHKAFINTIERRHLLEEQMLGARLPTEVKSNEFKNLPWVENEAELQDRLLRIKSLQLETADKLSQTDKDQLLQKLTKRRLTREIELKGKNDEELKQTSLAYTL